jgi:outer membrane scaffolding protein for murein synthesis (MipA/OmpV family)
MKVKLPLCGCALAAALLAAPTAGQAQEQAPELLPLWEVGAVGLAMSQQAYPGASQNVGRGLALPYLIYRGKYLRADRESVGLRAFNTPQFELDVGFAAAFGARSDEVDARRGMPDLGTLVEFGPRLKWHLGQGPGNGRLRAEFALRGVFDLDDRLSHKGISFEPRLIYEWRGSGWRYGTSAGAVLGNRRLADTYYGVAPAYATTGRPAYTAESGLINWRLGVNMSRDMTPNLRLFGFVWLDSVAGAANRASPLVQKTTGTSVGVGLTYTFARSATLVRD